MKPIKSKLLRATADDIKALQELAASTFYDTYNHLNPEGIVPEYIEKNLNEASLLEEMAVPNTVFFILWIENKAAGYIQLRQNDKVSETLGTDKHLELLRIYVRKAYQGQSFGKFLLQQAQDYAQIEDCIYLWLGVWSENHKAMSFYKSQGFEVFDEHIFWMGDDAQKDWLMKKKVG